MFKKLRLYLNVRKLEKLERYIEKPIEQPKDMLKLGAKQLVLHELNFLPGLLDMAGVGDAIGGYTAKIISDLPGADTAFEHAMNAGDGLDRFSSAVDLPPIVNGMVEEYVEELSSPGEIPYNYVEEETGNKMMELGAFAANESFDHATQNHATPTDETQNHTAPNHETQNHTAPNHETPPPAPRSFLQKVVAAKKFIEQKFDALAEVAAEKITSEQEKEEIAARARLKAERVRAKAENLIRSMDEQSLDRVGNFISHRQALKDTYDTLRHAVNLQRINAPARRQASVELIYESEEDLTAFYQNQARKKAPPVGYIGPSRLGRIAQEARAAAAAQQAAQHEAQAAELSVRTREATPARATEEASPQLVESDETQPAAHEEAAAPMFEEAAYAAAQAIPQLATDSDATQPTQKSWPLADDEAAAPMHEEAVNAATHTRKEPLYADALDMANAKAAPLTNDTTNTEVERATTKQAVASEQEDVQLATDNAVTKAPTEADALTQRMQEAPAKLAEAHNAHKEAPLTEAHTPQHAATDVQAQPEPLQEVELPPTDDIHADMPPLASTTSEQTTLQNDTVHADTFAQANETDAQPFDRTHSEERTQASMPLDTHTQADETNALHPTAESAEPPLDIPSPLAQTASAVEESRSALPPSYEQDATVVPQPSEEARAQLLQQALQAKLAPRNNSVTLSAMHVLEQLQHNDAAGRSSDAKFSVSEEACLELEQLFKEAIDEAKASVFAVFQALADMNKQAKYEVVMTHTQQFANHYRDEFQQEVLALYDAWHDEGESMQRFILRLDGGHDEEDDAVVAAAHLENTLRQYMVEAFAQEPALYTGSNLVDLSGYGGKEKLFTDIDDVLHTFQHRLEQLIAEVEAAVATHGEDNELYFNLGTILTSLLTAYKALFDTFKEGMADNLSDYVSEKSAQAVENVETSNEQLKQSAEKTKDMLKDISSLFQL